jgi:hypothetical protein
MLSNVCTKKILYSQKNNKGDYRMKENVTVKGLLILLILIWVICPLSFAQERRAGTASGTQLLLPVGGQGFALSGAGIATTTGIDAMFWNPAGLAKSDKVEAMFSSMQYIADVNVNYLAASMNFQDIGSVGFSLKSVNFGDISRTTAEDPDGLTGATFSPTYLTTALTYSRSFTDRVQVGFTSKLITESILGVSAIGFGFDVGIQYLTPFNLKIGLAIKNLGGSMRYSGSDLERLVPTIVGQGDADKLRAQITASEAEIPSVFDIGVGYDFNLDKRGNNIFTIVATLRNNNFSDDEYLFGAEYGFQKLLFFRGGYSYSSNVENVFSSSLTAGLGLNYRLGNLALRFDYTYRTATRFDGNQALTLHVGF